MTDNLGDLGFNEKQEADIRAYNSRRESLQFALPLIDKEVDTADILVQYANVIHKWLNEGEVPE